MLGARNWAGVDNWFGFCVQIKNVLQNRFEREILWIFYGPNNSKHNQKFVCNLRSAFGDWKKFKSRILKTFQSDYEISTGYFLSVKKFVSKILIWESWLSTCKKANLKVKKNIWNFILLLGLQKSKTFEETECPYFIVES